MFCLFVGMFCLFVFDFVLFVLFCFGWERGGLIKSCVSFL